MSDEEGAAARAPGAAGIPSAETAPGPDGARSPRGRYVGAAIVCGVVVVVAIALVVVLSDNVVYYRTVSEAVVERPEQGTDRFRLAGAVVPGSIREERGGVRFAVSDGEATVMVVHRGDPPDLFKGDAPVVCEGRWGAGNRFASDRILIKHGEDYEAPKVDTKRAPEADAA